MNSIVTDITNKPPVLVTGGAGYIGSHAVLALIDAGWPVAVIDDLSTGFRFAVPDGVAFYEGDIADGALLTRIFAEHDIRAVMHFAGSILVGESVVKPLLYYHNNTAKSLTLIESAIAAGISHFIFSSSAAVYGVPPVTPIPENAPMQPINPYGRSKLMTERMLMDSAAVSEMNFAALRYFNVAGADPQMRSGESTAKATHLVKVAVEAAVGKRNGVGVFGTDYDTPDGTGVRDYVHVSDLANAHILAMAELVRRPDRSLTLNCGYGRGFSVREVLDAADRVVGRSIDRRIEPRRAGDPDTLVADPAFLRATLDWVPAHDDLETIIAHALEWEQKLAVIRGRSHNIALD